MIYHVFPGNNLHHVPDMIHILDHYEDYRYIAQNAVEWSTANMDRMLSDDFESLIHEITGRRFPKRLID